MGEIIMMGFCICGLWSIIGYIICLCIFIMRSGFFDFFNPCWIYAHIRVNIIGCILLTIFTNILSLVIAIGYWIYKICTVGRKYEGDK